MARQRIRASGLAHPIQPARLRRTSIRMALVTSGTTGISRTIRRDRLAGMDRGQGRRKGKGKDHHKDSTIPLHKGMGRQEDRLDRQDVDRPGRRRWDSREVDHLRRL